MVHRPAVGLLRIGAVTPQHLIDVSRRAGEEEPSGRVGAVCRRTTDGLVVATYGAGPTVELWNGETGTRLGTVEGHRETFNPGGSHDNRYP